MQDGSRQNGKIGDARAESEAQLCDWSGCAEAGLYRAPKSRDALGEYYWFCLQHVRRYNAEWDFFADKTESDIDAYRRASVIGHRPTWQLGSGFLGPDWAVEDLLDLMSLHPGVRSPFEGVARRAARQTLTPKERRALEQLGLDETAAGDDIKKQFRILVKRYHPDSNGGRRTEHRLREIIQAYNDLKDSGRLAGQEAGYEKSEL